MPAGSLPPPSNALPLLSATSALCLASFLRAHGRENHRSAYGRKSVLITLLGSLDGTGTDLKSGVPLRLLRRRSNISSANKSNNLGPFEETSPRYRLVGDSEKRGWSYIPARPVDPESSISESGEADKYSCFGDSDDEERCKPVVPLFKLQNKRVEQEESRNNNRGSGSRRVESIQVPGRNDARTPLGLRALQSMNDLRPGMIQDNIASAFDPRKLRGVKSQPLPYPRRRQRTVDERAPSPLREEDEVASEKSDHQEFKFDSCKLQSFFHDGFIKHVVWRSKSQCEITEWNRSRILGRGTFGTVWLEKERRQGTLRAVKEMRKDVIGQEYSREILAMAKLKKVR